MGLSLVVSGAMAWMLAWVNSLQMVIHLPMMHVLVPPNVSAAFSSILPIVTFDVFNAFSEPDPVDED